jgi:hypothetical protein
MTDVPIKPTPFDKEIVSVQISLDSFQLNATEGTASAYMYDASGRLLDVQRVQITPEEWASWGFDDQYIIDLVLAKLGYEPA